MLFKLAAALVSVLFAPLVLGQESADLILFNGKIFTSDIAHPFVQALAIRGEYILATGESTKIKALAGPQTKLMDLAGRTVIPGIDDAHIHLGIEPANTIELEFKNQDPPWAEVREGIVAAVLKAPNGTTISGGISSKAFFNPELNRGSLDQASPKHPVILETLTGHALVLNTAAMAELGIRESQVDPMGGRYERTPDGKLTGVIREYAVLQIKRKIADLTSSTDALAELRDTIEEATKLGITSLQDMSSEIISDRCVELLKTLSSPIRIRVIRMPTTLPNRRDKDEGAALPGKPSSMITVSGIKWMLDGTPDEGTFAPRENRDVPSAPPLDPLFRNLQLTFPPKEMEGMLWESLNDNEQLVVHVAGYPAASEMLNAMQATGGPKVWATRRVRFEHGDGLFPDLFLRAKQMGVVVVQNPSHLNDAPEVGPDLFNVAHPLKSLIVAGIPVALGSDGPMNPYLNIMLATKLTDRHSEAITREQAVIAYTLTSAYAEFAEKIKGSLEPGKLADLAVLSQDIFVVPAEEMPNTVSLLTLVGGKVVYEAMVLKPN